MRSERRQGWGIAQRLLVLGLIVSVLFTSLAGWMLRGQLHAALERVFLVGLHERADRLRSELESSGLAAARGGRLGQGEFGRIFSGWYWVLQHGDGSLQSRSVWDATLELERARVLDERGYLGLSDPQDRPLMGLRQPLQLDGRSAVLYVFGPLDDITAEARRVDRILLLAQLGLILALVAGTTLQLRVGLAPLRRMQRRLGEMEAGRRDRLGGGFGPDLAPLAGTVDRVLERNAEVVERARHHAADLSHALKKPLALLGTQARLAQVEGPWLQEQVQAMARTIDRHLARFASGACSEERVELAPALSRLVELMRVIHASRALDWELRVDAPRPWRGAPSDLEEMVGNLLDNAGKWARHRIVLEVTQAGPLMRIAVEDDGVGMDPAQLAQALQPVRGQRFDEQVEGHGLGLAIVRDIAETYGGQLSHEPGRLDGLRLVLVLPLD